MKGIIMTIRHSIDLSTVTVTPNGTFGMCNACNFATKLFTFVHKGKKSYRCSVPILAKRASKKAQKSDDKSLASSQTLALSNHVDDWDTQQQGNCRMCNTHLRWNNKTQSRALYVVPINGETILKGLYCWDCRTLLREHISQKHTQLMRDIINQGYVVVSPPQK
jgi:hypothetical protein